jgi:hypothetical protein
MFPLRHPRGDAIAAAINSDHGYRKKVHKKFYLFFEASAQSADPVCPGPEETPTSTSTKPSPSLKVINSLNK